MTDNDPRELRRRESGGLEVRLLSYPRKVQLTIAVTDDRSRQMFEFDVAAKCAEDAFRNPYAYAPVDVVLRAAEHGLEWTPRAATACAAERRPTSALRLAA